MNVSLNFLWIQANRLTIPTSGSGVSCPIPEGLRNNVDNIAKEHPDIPINIWVDIYGIGNHNKGIVQELNNQEVIPNINIRTLEEMEAYRNHPIFKIPFEGIYSGSILWDQIDFAKSNIIHTLLKEGQEAAIFTDMDMDLLSDKFGKAVGILKEKGAVVGLEEKNGSLGLENQFFGFSQAKINFVENVLVQLKPEDIDKDEEYSRFIAYFKPNITDFHGIVRDEITIPMDKISNWRKIKISYQDGP